MCGRYLFSTKESREMQKILRDAERRSRGRFPGEMTFRWRVTSPPPR